MNIARFLITASLAVGCSFAVQAEEIVLKFSHVTAAKGHPKGEAAALFAERVNEKMKGRVKIEVYPNSTLYNDDKVIEALLLGDVQLASPSLSKTELLTKKFRLFDLPFLFDDIQAVDRFQSSPKGQELLDSMQGNGIQGLAYWHNGMKQLSANKPLIKPEDAKGLKFRVQSSEVLQEQFRILGASPQKLPFSEVYSALQTGVVDGQENTWSNIATKKFYEVQDGITETNHGVLDYIVITSAEFWQSLPEDIRTELSDILKEVTEERNKLSAEINQKNKQVVIDSGSQVRTLTEEQKEAWRTVMKPVWEKFLGDIGQNFLDAAVQANTK